MSIRKRVHATNSSFPEQKVESNHNSSNNNNVKTHTQV